MKSNNNNNAQAITYVVSRKLPNGDTYTGDIDDGKKHGTGVLTCSNGNTLHGEWQNDKLHGKMLITSLNGKTCNGEFKSDKKNGQWELKMDDGSVYNGGINGYGDPHGYGVFIFPNGNIFDGEWQDSKRLNLQSFQRHKDTTFRDTYQNGKVIIKEKTVFHNDYTTIYHYYNNNDKEISKVQWNSSDTPNGAEYVENHEFNNSNGVYTGYTKNDKKHGYGKTYANNQTSIGEWNNNSLWNGQSCEFNGGNIYRKFFSEGKKTFEEVVFLKLEGNIIKHYDTKDEKISEVSIKNNNGTLLVVPFMDNKGNEQFKQKTTQETTLLSGMLNFIQKQHVKIENGNLDCDDQNITNKIPVSKFIGGKQSTQTHKSRLSLSTLLQKQEVNIADKNVDCNDQIITNHVAQLQGSNNQQQNQGSCSIF